MGNRWDKMISTTYKNQKAGNKSLHHVYSSPSLIETQPYALEERSSSFAYGGDMDMCGENNDGMDSDCSVSSNSGKQVIVGVCAMAKKTQSKPMKEILTRLQEFEYIKMVVFPEEVIITEPVERWPICDCLISFHSKGFPLEKAIQYAQLRKPYVINNLHMQYDIQDRRRVYAILEGEGIEIPRYAVLDRDSPDPKKHELIESEDHVEVNGVIFNKPFVEKPVSAEDHNIYIYYPTSAGGGSQRLFRKIGSRSSVYSPESRVRKTGSFIYEDFMPTDGTDVKVYTVGPDYAHAEARKSPALDGKVERDSEGKEIRYPVILNNAEKLISRKVCLAFKQTVCGFDLLRANGKSYVCDVNGFSFVKNSNKYYDDCAKILGNMILRELTPTLHIPWSVPFQLDDPPIVPTTFGKMMELRCVVAVIRHGDRTPKQKMKVEVRHPKFFEIFEKYDGYKHGHVKLKRPKQLQEILDIARSLLDEIKTKAADCEIEEKQGKLEQLKSVLEMYGHFSGINRKVQMKYQPKGRPRGSSSDDDVPKEPSLVLILKWGGELTPAGRIQAEELGRIFRCMYPGGQGRHDYSGTQGLGLLRLHSTFRHDLKIYASDEGRVQMTAAAFAKGLLALEGELTPILVQMVKSANTNGLLDNDCDSSKYQNMAKNRLHELMQIDREFTKDDREAINPGNSISINQAMDFVKNPFKCCAHVHSLIQSLLGVISVKKEDPKTKDAVLYHGETWDLMGRRWEKIEKDFSTKSKTFDISKIPDIYDCIKYDLQHNQHTLQYEQAEELYIYAKYLADIVIPQEYGLTIQEKLAIGQGICTPLLKKIKADLQRNIEEPGDESVNRLNPRYSHGVSSPGRHVRTRLYFTSESHVHSLLTVLRFGGLLDIIRDEQWRRAMEYISMVSELNYMSQIVIMLYEDPTKDPSSEERFHVELHFSPGVNCCVQKNLPPGPGFRPHSRNDSAQSKNISPDDSMHTRIDEENDVNLEDTPPHSSKNHSEQTSPEEQNEVCALPRPGHRVRHHKASKPIPIGAHHTVCGHEAMDLAKRLSEELAAQQTKQSGSFEANRPLSPEAEPRSRSYEQRDQKTKENCNKQKFSVVGCTPLYRIASSTNELPLSEIDFSMNPITPESLITNPLDNPKTTGGTLDNKDSLRCISPIATNERPLSCNCLVSMCEEDLQTAKHPKLIMDSFNRTSIDSRRHSGKNQSFFSSADNIKAEVFVDTFQTSSSAPANLDSCYSDSVCYLQPKTSFSRSQSTFFNSNKIFGCFFSLGNTINRTSQSQYSSPSTLVPSPVNNSSFLDSNMSHANLYNTSTPSITFFAADECIPNCSINSIHSETLTNLNPITPHPKIDKLHNPENTTSASSSSSASSRRQRHGIAGQMSYIKMLGFGGFGKKMATSTNSLFSTAVISGSSSAPNLRDMIPSTATPSVLEGFGGVPPIRPLETLHNALSLKQLDVFLEKMTTAPLFKTPASSPPKYPSTPVPTPVQTPQNSIIEKPTPICSSWSEQSSLASSIGNLSGTEPSSPAISETYSRGQSSTEFSLISNDGANLLPMAEQISKYFPKLDEDLNSVCAPLDLIASQSEDVFMQDGDNCLTPVSFSSDINTTAATKGSTNTTEFGNDMDDDEATLSIDTCSSTAGDELELVKSSVLNKSTIFNSEKRAPPRIQKQISLFESERIAAAESKLQPNTSKLNLRRRKFGTVDSTFLTQSSSNDSLSLGRIFATPKKDSKTRSCMNLKSCIALHPGAVLVKEMFIDPPKRIARSFHGKTGHERAGENQVVDTLTGNNGQKLRFITTKVEEIKDNK